MSGHAAQTSLFAPQSLAAANVRGCYGEKPPDDASGYIHACFLQKWKLATWRRDGTGPVVWRPARCHSWRHAGPCAAAKAAQDYVRIRDALAQHDRAHVHYLVLTLDPSAWTGEGWIRASAKGVVRRPDAKCDNSAILAAYLALGDRWKMFAQAFRRRFGELAYVATVESHRSGWPHLNVILVSPTLAKSVEKAEVGLENWERKAKGRELAARCIGDMLVKTGFGRIAFLESAMAIAGEKDRIAAYISKLAGQTGTAWDGEGRGLVDSIEGRVIGEIAKLSQVPTRAPEGFRRLRSSKGFLPPAQSCSEEYTGGIYDEAGDEVGRSSADRLIRAALLAVAGPARDALAAEINDAIDRESTSMGVEDEDGVVRPPRASSRLRKLYRASRTLEGRDGAQLLEWAQRETDAKIRVRLLDCIEGELWAEAERRAEYRDRVHHGDARFAILRSDNDVAKLKKAKDLLTSGETVEPDIRRLLAPDIGIEIRTRRDVVKASAGWGFGPTLSGPASRRYVLRH